MIRGMSKQRKVVEETEQRKVVEEIGGGWVVTMEWPEGVEDGGPGRLVIEPVGKMPVGGLSSTVLRQINFRAAIETMRAVAEYSRKGDPVQDFERDQLRAALAEGVTDRYLALLSWHYVRAVKRGQARINDYLAQIVGKPTSTVRGHLWQARNKGLLSGAPGRKGGALSEEAEDLVETYALEWLAKLDELRPQRPSA